MDVAPSQPTPPEIKKGHSKGSSAFAKQPIQAVVSLAKVLTSTPCSQTDASASSSSSTSKPDATDIGEQVPSGN